MISYQKNTKIKLHFERFEFKYQLPLETVEGIIPELLKYMEPDAYAASLPNGSYTVASVYFDSAGFGCYYEKINGLHTRKKLRIRSYGLEVTPQTPVFFEIKKKYDAVVIKDRLTLPYAAAVALFDGGVIPEGLSADERATLDEFLSLRLRNGMEPQNLIVYQRRPFVSKVDPGFRVTIDYGIKTASARSLTSYDDWRDVQPNTAVLEVKFNNILPFWFHRIIQRYGLGQLPFSKYCFSLDRIHPELVGATMIERFNPHLTHLTIN